MKTSLLWLFLALGAVVGFAGCEEKDAGDHMEDAVESVGDAAKDTADEVGDAVEDATDRD
jgi:hypothetical protein